jgi:uncharacterized phage-associated protein
MKTYSARDIAEYFLRLSIDKDSGELISNLKLQKLVYYAQALCLAGYNQQLFNDPIQAWAHGPVVESLYHAFKHNQGGAIKPTASYPMPTLDKQTKDLLNEVYRTLGQYSAWRLREMTHSETPWIKANAKGSGSLISHEDMAKYFKPYINIS